MTTYRDTIPVLIYHHHAEQHAQREEEEPVNIMFDGIADRHAERKEDYLRDSEEGGPEKDVTNRPTVFQSAEDEDQLRDYVNDNTDQWPKDIDNPKRRSFGVLESSKALESGNGDEE